MYTYVSPGEVDTYPATHQGLIIINNANRYASMRLFMYNKITVLTTTK